MRIVKYSSTNLGPQRATGFALISNGATTDVADGWHIGTMMLENTLLQDKRGEHFSN